MNDNNRCTVVGVDDPVHPNYILFKLKKLKPYLYKILLNVLKGFVLCYSYSLFYYRWDKPLVNISIILSIHNILMVIATIIIYSL